MNPSWSKTTYPFANDGQKSHTKHPVLPPILSRNETTVTLRKTRVRTLKTWLSLKGKALDRLTNSIRTALLWCFKEQLFEHKRCSNLEMWAENIKMPHMHIFFILCKKRPTVLDYGVTKSSRVELVIVPPGGHVSHSKTREKQILYVFSDLLCFYKVQRRLLVWFKPHSKHFWGVVYFLGLERTTVVAFLFISIGNVVYVRIRGKIIFKEQHFICKKRVC